MTSQILYYAYKIYNNGGGSTVWLQLLPSTKNMISVGFFTSTKCICACTKARTMNDPPNFRKTFWGWKFLLKDKCAY